MTAEPSIHPFPGLRHFETNEEHLFFGREGQSEEILRRLRQNRFLAVVGSSGSGKSSLIRAGLLPYLYWGFLAGGGSHWRVAIFRPGSDPIASLAGVLNDHSVLGQQPAIARRMFQALTEKGPDNREARRPTTVATLGEVTNAPVSDIFRIIEVFRRPGRSFLMPSAGVQLDIGSVIDISHESLIRGWRRLRQWVEEEAESARTYRRLAETAALYDLAHAVAWRKKEDPNAAWAARYHPGFGSAMAFLENSRVVREAERHQKESQRRRVLVASLAVALVLGIVAVSAVWEWRSADLERGRVEQALTTATELSNSLVFNIGQDPRLRSLADLAGQIFDQAIQAYDQLIRINPTALAFNGRGAARYGKNDYDRAIADYDQAIQLDPKNSRAYGNRGLAYFGKKDQDRAIADYDQAIQLDPKYVVAYYNRGIAYNDKGDQDRAIADYDQAIQLDPKYSRAYGNRGLAYRDKGDLDRAIADYDQVIQLDPKDSLAYSNRGLAYRDKGDLDRAIADYDQVIQLDPKNVLAYNRRGLAYRDKGDLDRAIADYDQAIQLDPKYVVAYYNRGLAYRNKGDHDRAIADYDQAIQLDPKYSRAYGNRGLAYSDKGDLDRAIADYDQVIQLDPKDSLAYSNRGLAYRDKGDLDRAIADYDQAIQLDPKYVVAYYNRGLAYRVKGDLDRTIADYDQAIQLDPKDSLAYSNRGLAYRDKGDLDRAIADYDQAIQLDPKYVVAYYNRGLAYRDKGDLDRAIADYDQAIQLDPNDDFTYLNRGLAYLYSANPAKALADVIQATELNQEDAHNALWVDIVGQRNNVPSRLSQAIAKIDMTAWPAPIIRLFLGQLTPAAVLAAADDPDATKKKGQVCEANFFGGEFALRMGAKDEATRLFRLAASDCPKDFVEWGAANAELRAVGGTR